jgi:hypothetical protein
VDGVDVVVDHQAGKVDCTDPGLQVRERRPGAPASCASLSQVPLACLRRSFAGQPRSGFILLILSGLAASTGPHPEGCGAASGGNASSPGGSAVTARWQRRLVNGAVEPVHCVGPVELAVLQGESK